MAEYSGAPLAEDMDPQGEQYGTANYFSPEELYRQWGGPQTTEQLDQRNIAPSSVGKHTPAQELMHLSLWGSQYQPQIHNPNYTPSSTYGAEHQHHNSHGYATQPEHSFSHTKKPSSGTYFNVVISSSRCARAGDQPNSPAGRSFMPNHHFDDYHQQFNQNVPVLPSSFLAHLTFSQSHGDPNPGLLSPTSHRSSYGPPQPSHRREPLVEHHSSESRGSSTEYDSRSRKVVHKRSGSLTIAKDKILEIGHRAVSKVHSMSNLKNSDQKRSVTEDEEDKEEDRCEKIWNNHFPPSRE